MSKTIQSNALRYLQNLRRRLPAVPFWIVERAREIAELKSRKQERTSGGAYSSLTALHVFGIFVPVFREPSRLSRKGLPAVYLRRILQNVWSFCRLVVCKTIRCFKSSLSLSFTCGLSCFS